MDVPLSEAGIGQSIALGGWFQSQAEKPTVIISSPYLRARETARIIAETISFENPQILFDERLRERELGIFDRLTKLGATAKYPEESQKRELVGKFYYRPPGGENWADVALRIRGVWRDLRENFAGAKILIVTHEVVVRVFRYVLENLSEAEIMAIDRAGDVENCAVTSYIFEAQTKRFVLREDNFCVK